MSELFRLKITSTNEVTIPARLRSRLQLNDGDELQVEVGDDDSVVVRKADRSELPIGPTSADMRLFRRRAKLPGSRELADRFLEEVKSQRSQSRDKANTASV